MTRANHLRPGYKFNGPMDAQIRQKAAIVKALCTLSLVSLLWAGCATRSYPGPVHGLTFDGTVQSIDLQRHLLLMVPLKPSKPAVFAYEESTKFWKNGTPIHADEVETGRSVRVHYHMMSGQPVANHVYIEVPYAPQH